MDSKRYVIIKENKENGIDIDEIKSELREYFPIAHANTSLAIGTDTSYGGVKSRALKVVSIWPGEEDNKGIDRLDEIVDEVYMKSKKDLYAMCISADTSQYEDVNVCEYGEYATGSTMESLGYGTSAIYSRFTHNPNEVECFEYDIKEMICTENNTRFRVYAESKEAADMKIRNVVDNVKLNGLSERINSFKENEYNNGIEVLGNEVHTIEQNHTYELSSNGQQLCYQSSKESDVEFAIDWGSIDN